MSLLKYVLTYVSKIEAKNSSIQFRTFSFSELRLLTNHVAKAHKKEKPFQCTKCEKRFASKQEQNWNKFAKISAST